MPRIRCFYEDCVFLREGYCSATLVEIDPDEGCLTYTEIAEAEPKAALVSVDDDEEDVEEDWEDEGYDELDELELEDDF